MTLPLVIFICSACAAVAIAGLHIRRNRAEGFTLLFLFLGCAAFTPALFGPQFQPKGFERDGAVGVAYAWMILGMSARYFHERFSRAPKKRPAHDAGRFLRPILVSPIVFLPMFCLIQHALLEGEPNALTSTWAFNFLSFQNGFFWKIILERSGKDPGPDL